MKLAEDVPVASMSSVTLSGGMGADTATYTGATVGVTVSLSVAGAQNTSSAGIDTLISIANLVGSAFGDGLIGNSNANILSGGGGGNDTFQFDMARRWGAFEHRRSTSCYRCHQ